MPNIEDFGEKIGGAKKDLWGLMKVDINVLKELTDLELLDQVNKTNIWPTPKWQELKGTKPDAVLYFIKNIRDSVPSKPTYSKYNTEREYIEAQAKAYTESVLNLIEYCDKNINTIEDIAPFYSDFAKSYGYYVDGKGWSNRAQNTPLFSTKKFYEIAKISQSGAQALISETRVQNFPEQFRGDLKGVHVRKYGADEQYVILKSGWSRVTYDTFASAEEAYAYIRNVYIPKLDKKKGMRVAERRGKIQVVRPQLQRIKRTGYDIRGGKDATTGDMMNLFKFRGGEFGNWNNDKDRQACLNYAFDAFVDLAYVLDIPIQKTSL